MTENQFIQKACELITDFENEHPEACYAKDDINILTSFNDEEEGIYHVVLMTDHIYDVQFNEDAIILEIYASSDFRRYTNEDEE